MFVNTKWLKEQRACVDGTTWFKQNFSGDADSMEVREKLISENRRDWAEWLTSHAWREVPALREMSAMKRLLRKSSASVRLNG
ncbi:MAG: hypothetical protein P4N59_07300 [Negativicutes bacterium]|nr:hypothetical protein [Negativicutes bacterium]